MSTSRRYFLTGSLAAAAGVAAKPTSANEQIVLGFMGVKDRGRYLLERFAKRKNVRITWLADVDRRFFDRADLVEKIAGNRPKVTQDFRRMLDDKQVDAVVMATPDHWHALGTILACQAGKDVYVEKPASHNIWEGRKMVEAARKYKRVVQVGSQNRSAPYVQAALEYIRSGKLGDIHYARVFNSKRRGSIGFAPDEPTPPYVDYDMWLGPARKRPFNRNHFHYAWHWFWEYSGGDIINDGVHQIDIMRWLIGRDRPKAVYSTGGMYFFHDAQETPDTHVATWDFDGLTVVFEQTLWAPYMKKTPMAMRDQDRLPTWPFSGTRIEIYGTKQKMFLSRHGGGWEVFDADGKSIHVEHGRQPHELHFDNFLECIRTRKRPNADIEELHLSTNLCHYANISYRLGRKLYIDPSSEGFVNDPEANALVKRHYREPWVVPERV